MPRRRTKFSQSELPGRISVGDTINSGQVFLWQRRGDAWFGIDGQNILKVTEDPFAVKSSSGGGTGLFRPDDDIGGIFSALSRDGTVRGAIRRFPGLRLLRQDPFQCYISFIVSSNSSIQRIRDGLQRICKRYGERAGFDGTEWSLFPTPEKLSGAKISDLARCGLGYRTKFVKQAARDVVDGRIDFDFLKKASYCDAREILIQTPGIGGKVADCILLFSLDKLESFPLDRWILRVLEERYPGVFPLEGKSMTARKYDELHGKIVTHFGSYAGYAQQFLFKMEREDSGKKWL